MDEVRLKAHAKLNLFLEIKSRRGDGYHDIVTLFHEIGLHDEITMRLAPGANDLLRVVASGGAGAPEGADNLCLRALDAFRVGAGIDARFEIELAKRIPVGAGLGGGSSDAAAAIRGANQLCGLRMSDAELERVAGAVGSDTAFFVGGGAAVGRGRGTELERVAAFGGEIWAVVAKPDFSVPTEWAYGQAGEYRGGRELDAREVEEKFSAGDREYLRGMLFNAFEEIIFPLRPELKSLKERLLEAGCRGALLCGSGSAVFGLCGGREEAEKAREKMAGGKGLEMIEVCALDR